jgi:hypothetical protein
MLVHEKALMTQMNKTLLPGISVTPTAGSAQESAERSASSSTEPPSKRSRTESPLINSALFDEDRIVSALQKDVDMNVQKQASFSIGEEGKTGISDDYERAGAGALEQAAKDSWTCRRQ